MSNRIIRDEKGRFIRFRPCGCKVLGRHKKDCTPWKQILAESELIRKVLE